MMLRQKKWDIAIAAVGFSAIVTQTIFLRELLTLFYGNELVIGIVLANWMILTGFGAFVGKHKKVSGEAHGLIFLILLFLSILPLLTIFTFEYLRNSIFAPGTMIGVGSCFLSSFFLLLPYCVFSGFAFILSTQILSEQYAKNKIGRAYSSEAIGSLLGGALLNLVLLVFCTTSQALLIVAFILLVTILFLSFESSSRGLRYLNLTLSILCVAIYFSVNLDRIMKSRLYEGQKLVLNKDTPYGTITVTSQGDQKNIFENGVLLTSNNNVQADEEAVHYAMVQHPHPKKVLLISGGMSGIPAEILKYKVDRIDYVEINPWLIEIGKSLISSCSDNRLHIISTDARRFIRSTEDQYDVVLINVSDPSTAQINRYYTMEFLRDLKKRLSPGAVISMGVHSLVDYFGAEALDLYSTLVKTLSTQFAHVLIVPGSKIFFLGSDQPLSITITKLIDDRNIPTDYVNRYYLEDDDLRQRSDEIMNRLNPQASINYDFTPVVYYRQMQYWLSYSRVTLWIPLSLVLIVILLILRRTNAIGIGMFVTGFAASGIEVLLLFSVQILYGIMYQATGFIITVFMGGLAIGAWCAQRWLKKPSMNHFAGILLMLGLFSILLPGILSLLHGRNSDAFLIYVIFILITLLGSSLVGLEFAIGTRLYRGTIADVASSIYSIDLLGSAIGAICVSVLLIPIAGIIWTFFIIGFLSLISALVLMTRRSIYYNLSNSEAGSV